MTDARAPQQFQQPPDHVTRGEIVGALEYWVKRAKTAEAIIAAHCPRQEASHELAHKIALALHPPTKYCTDNSVRLRTENVILEVLSGVVAGLSDTKEE